MHCVGARRNEIAMSIKCGQCGQENEILGTEGVCSSCGKPLALVASAGKEFVRAESIRRLKRLASSWLFGVAGFYIVSYGIAIAYLWQPICNGRFPTDRVVFFFAECLVVPLVFTGLAIWARRHTLLASVAGFVFFLCQAAAGYIANAGGNSVAAANALVIKVIPLIMLVFAIRCGQRVQTVSSQ